MVDTLSAYDSSTKAWHPLTFAPDSHTRSASI
jgi:hypothetical protein